MEYVITEQGDQYCNWLLNRKEELNDYQQRRLDVLLRLREGFPPPNDPDTLQFLEIYKYIAPAEVVNL